MMSVLSLAAGLLTALTAPRLTAEIVVLSAVPVADGHIRAELVIRNTGVVPVRIGTLVGHTGGGADGLRMCTYHPDFFKTNRPSPEQSAEKIVTLKPGEKWSFPLDWLGVRGKDGKCRIEAAFETGPEFAARHRTWAGQVHAKPAVIEMK